LEPSAVSIARAGENSMKITIINGNPDASNIEFDSYLKKLSGILVADNHVVTAFNLRDMEIRYCTGCLNCFVKTPGECILKDASAEVLRKYINSDFALFASPVIMGFTSALLKKVQDRLTPLLLPYFDLSPDGVRHVGRYAKFPNIGLLLEKSKGIDGDTIKIIQDVYARYATNIKSSLIFVKLTSSSVEEVRNEINHL
jgi:multimeric flavodoxin WrbA